MPQPTQTADQVIYTTEEAAKKLRMSVRTLLDGARSGRFPASKPAWKWLFTEADIQQILDATRRTPAAESDSPDNAPALTARQRRKAS